ncbi:MAG: hypothetical protein ABJM19_06130 [Marinobacter sp.]|uniref:hypothetical protein n=1 Tax=unclassified Marinobacter TaxID=83889 RepID=UPI00273A8B82|nr:MULTISPECIES: hypothetical protein [unclassified Marinobacter]MDP4547741.1 hypothetical protein [Marinobacter sp. MDS2]
MTVFRKKMAAGARLRGFVAAVAASVALSGCGVVNHMVYKTTGDVMQGFSRNHTVPYLMQSDDLAMGCAMSEATAPLLMSFGRVTSEPDQIAVMLYLSAGGCAEERATGHELDGMAKLYANDGIGAEDAFIQKKRAYSVAAKRYFKGWQHHNAHYGNPDGGECPSFDDEADEFIYMAGLLSGMQALSAQIQAASSIGVPFNTGSVVGRASQCLDNNQWWGAPMGLRATVWAMIPGTQPQGEDAFERLAAAQEQGKEAGVRLGHVFHAIAATNKNDIGLVKDIIRDFAESEKTVEVSEDWRFIDAMARNMLVTISDKLWMENTGHRTPTGRFGSFWDDQRAPVETMDLDDLL